jgi:predicted lipid-binding transport protein (Tim44 family)
MKKLSLSLLLLPLLCAGLPAAEDCAKSRDACSGAAKKSSPFLDASLRETPAPAQAAPAVLREAPAAPAPAQAAPAVLREAPAAAATEPSPAAAEEPAAGKRPLSSPLWTLFAGAVLAGVYFYLAAGRKKGRKR